MYCPKCECDFVGWTGKCPIDGTLLVELSPIPDKPTHAPVPYETIVDLIRENSGSYEIELRTTEVGRDRKMSFPYRGYGFAWAEELAGDCGKSIRADMKTVDVGRDKNWFLFYFGLGYAWVRRATLVLSLADNISLK